MTYPDSLERIDGCPACWPEHADAAWDARGQLVPVKELLDESHRRLTLRACAACGQHFVSAFAEEVDWADGDDPQYWSMIPVRMSESTRLVTLAEEEVFAAAQVIAAERRALHRDAPKGAPVTCRWHTGLV